MIKTLSYFFSLCAILSSCSIGKHLAEDERFISSIVLEKNKNFSFEEIKPILRQSSNSKFLGLPIYPRIWIYYQAKKQYDKHYVQDSLRIIQLKSKYEKDKQEFDLIDADSTVRKTKINRMRIRLETKKKKINKLKEKLENGNYFMRVIGRKPHISKPGLLNASIKNIRAYAIKNGFLMPK